MNNLLEPDYMELNNLSIDRAAHKRRWAPIPYTGWCVSSRGEVRHSRGGVPHERIGYNGARAVAVRRSGSAQGDHRYVNELVLEFFGSPRPSPQHRPMHRDNDQSNCHISNLSWTVFRPQEGERDE